MLFRSVYAFAGQNIGVIVKIKGDVKVFTNPGKKIKGPSPHVLFEGLYYSVRLAKLGFKVQNNNIITTGKDSRARVVFKNGDQYNIGEATVYKATFSSYKYKKKKSSSIVNLIRGKFRAIVSQKGPRKNLKVETKNASFGVRGTDFFINKLGNTKTTDVSVLRGEVALVKKKGIKKPTIVKRGFSAKVDKPAVVLVKPTTKRQLLIIQKNSRIVLKPDERPKASPKILKEIQQLEKMAVKSTLEDIKDNDPELYAHFQKKRSKSISTINTQVIKRIFKNAPEEVLQKDDLEYLEEDAYQKYFNLEK